MELLNDPYHGVSPRTQPVHGRSRVGANLLLSEQAVSLENVDICTIGKITCQNPVWYSVRLSVQASCEIGWEGRLTLVELLLKPSTTFSESCGLQLGECWGSRDP